MKQLYIVVFLAVFLNSCVVTELLIKVGEKDLRKTDEAELAKARESLSTLHMSLMFREWWSYPVIVLGIPFSVTADIILDIVGWPYWIKHLGMD